MSQAHFIVTDSDGIQEEAPSLGMPVVVMCELATKGIDVVGVDVEAARVEAVNAGEAYIAKPDLPCVANAAADVAQDIETNWLVGKRLIDTRGLWGA